MTKVENVEYKEFNFKSDDSNTKKYGVIAQEVEEAGLDDLVSTDKEGIKSVDYISLICLEIAALKERIR